MLVVGAGVRVEGARRRNGGLKDSTHPIGGTDGLGWWLAAAILCVFGILAKYTMVLLPIAVVGYLLIPPAHASFAGLAFGSCSRVTLGWLPILYWNATHDWVTFRHVWGQVGTGSGSGLRGLAR